MLWFQNHTKLWPHKTMNNIDLLTPYFSFELPQDHCSQRGDSRDVMCGTAIFPTNPTRGPAHELVLCQTLDSENYCWLGCSRNKTAKIFCSMRKCVRFSVTYVMKRATPKETCKANWKFTCACAVVELYGSQAGSEFAGAWLKQSSRMGCFRCDGARRPQQQQD